MDVNPVASRQAAVDPVELLSGALWPAVAAPAEEPRQTLEQRVERALASALKIDGTPAFIVGDTIIPGADMAALRAGRRVVTAGAGRRARRPQS